MNDYFLIFSMQFDRDQGLDWGRLSLNSISEGWRSIWSATTSTQFKQNAESFHQTGGLIPPQYRCSTKKWTVITSPLDLSGTKGIEGNFYKILPFEVVTDRNGRRGDFGIHKDANVPGSLGCIVLPEDRFSDFEEKMKGLAQANVQQLPLFVQYS